jgi:ACT domain-containing protein
MGIYNGAVITSTGQALLAQSVAGSELKFTTIKTSNYVYPAGTSLVDLTTLTGIKQSKNITGAAVYNSRVIKVSAMVDNAGVTAEYSINTIGVYATVGTAAEQLFAVITAQEADKMPAFNSRPYSYIYDMNMTMQGTANITVTVNNAGFVNINDLNNALDGVNDSITNLDETVNGRIDTLSSSVDTRIGALNDAYTNLSNALTAVNNVKLHHRNINVTTNAQGNAGITSVVPSGTVISVVPMRTDIPILTSVTYVQNITTNPWWVHLSNVDGTALANATLMLIVHYANVPVET